MKIIANGPNRRMKLIALIDPPEWAVEFEGVLLGAGGVDNIPP